MLSFLGGNRPGCCWEPHRASSIRSPERVIPITQTTPHKLAEVHQADLWNGPFARSPEVLGTRSKEGTRFPLVIATMTATESQRNIAVGIVIRLDYSAVLSTVPPSYRWPEFDASFRFCRPSPEVLAPPRSCHGRSSCFSIFNPASSLSILALASGLQFSGSFAFLADPGLFRWRQPPLSIG